MKPDAAIPAPPAAAETSRSWVGDVLVLAKVRLNALVVLTTAGGYYMASPVDVDPIAIAFACAGTGLVASGASAFNQVQERALDRLMERTRRRPMAEGRMGVAEGVLVAAALSLLGLALLWWFAKPAATALAAVTLLTYVAVYTPLKRVTSLSTVVGAVPGALPPLIGWAAAGGPLAAMAPWSLFVLMFLWQLPHFLAIAWIYREDYARAGMPMLAVIDRHGAVTGSQAALWAAALIPFSQLPFLLHLATRTYAIGALVLGVGQFVIALQFARHRSVKNARALFFASITYLPLLWALMCLGRR